ncbi:MAG: amidohydrolase family protein [Candidatus Eremiobacteraeota bacterium]|nr:amidohydrolase family protein [Candidatus Eremiobacteraeota bacterium]
MRRPFISIALAAAWFCICPERGLGAATAPASPYVAYRQPVIAIAHVRVIDGTGAPALPDQTVLFSNGTIRSIEKSKASPPNAFVIDGTGKTLMPGYVGTHNHLFTGVGPRGHHRWRAMPFSFPRLYLAAGTTTIRTTGSMDIYSDMNAKAAIDAGTSPGPDIDLTSPYLTGPGNEDPQMDALRDVKDARETVGFWADRGVTSFKVYTYVSHDALQAVVAEAHARGLKVLGHLCSIGYHEAAALGIDSLEHGPYFTDTEFVPDRPAIGCVDNLKRVTSNAAIDPRDPRMTALIADLVARHVAVSSTLPVFESEDAPPSDAIEAPTLATLAPEERDYVVAIRKLISGPFPAEVLKNYPHVAADETRLFANETQFELEFLRAGGLLTCGPDPSGYGAVVAGYGDWRELELLVAGGFTPLEAIHVATQNGAISLGREATIGTIAAGKKADLILVDGDPSITISDIERVDTVFKNGLGYDSKKLFASVAGLVGDL